MIDSERCCAAVSFGCQGGSFIAHLGGLRLDFASTGEGAVHFTHDCDGGSVVDEVEPGRVKTGIDGRWLVMARRDPGETCKSQSWWVPRAGKFIT